ncbi:TPA: antA/AntB antirepressor family protein [Campylobacter jejuni]|uniref:antA/AntB antirepressor family protein n=1 Tax=Campylobacter jejuni TaxID=197 RepID=UPI00069CBB98|nr:antA/AntB antirepressor family protein [Campylobacter jejuni]EAK0290961.1 phage antirepressor Ant [Campylobacter jejuni]ECL1841373.1 phage antirepressor Ant [Campylobacter jejuni]ECL3701042.1 phage antirepressor Ant [Campylobacter jejuni]ECL6519815.1 phage antirepressor Ant [Campylobacter jejuni]ECQ0490554.1 phage antirepressor Ant [Campylobacter jejuni]
MELSIYFPHTELQGAFPANVKFLFYFLEIDTKFADWIKNRISHYNFIENQDYIIKIVYTKGRPRKEYYVTLDMAKELCMVENNEKGRQARRYFIECEKRLKNLEQEQMQKLAFRQSLGYKSQLAQQKQKYENEIKALKYDLEQSKNNFKDKLNCILAKNGLYAFDFKTFKNYALKLEKMLKDLKDDENKENKLLLRMQNDFLECLELYKSVNI